MVSFYIIVRQMVPLPAQCPAHPVLKIAPRAAVTHALVHDAETEHIARGSSQITRKRGHPLHSARFGMHIALGGRVAHTFAQRAVLASYGQGGVQVAVDVIVVVSIAQQTAYGLGREIVVERQARPVGYLVVRRLESNVPEQRIVVRHSLLASGTRLAPLCGKLVKERFGGRVVALLEHGQQHLVDVARAGAYKCGI